MRRLVSPLIVVIFLSGSSSAADLSSRKVSENTSLPSWTGFYVGMNSGAMLGNGSVDFSSHPYYARQGAVVGNTANDSTYASTVALTSSSTLPINNYGSFIGGVQLGYNWRIVDRAIFSLETDAQGIAGSSSNTVTRMPVAIVPNANDNAVALSFLNASRSLDFLGTVRGRLGYLIFPSILTYATAGFSYGYANLNASSYQAVIRTPTTNPSNPRVQLNYGSAPFNGITVGWVAGAGFEWMVFKNWSLKTEYLYYDVGAPNVNSGSTSRIILQDQGQNTLLWSNMSRAQSDFYGHIIRVGVNYNFSR